MVYVFFLNIFNIFLVPPLLLFRQRKVSNRIGDKSGLGFENENTGAVSKFFLL